MNENNFKESLKNGLANFNKGNFSNSEIIFRDLLKKYPKNFNL